MTRTPLVVAAAAWIALAGGVAVQATGPATAPRVVARGAVASAPVRPGVFRGDLRDLPLEPQWQPGDPIRDVPRRTGPPERPPSPPEPRLDPLLADQLRAPVRALASRILDFAGQGYTGTQPPDTVGDVGLAYYIQAVNAGGGARYVVYDKSDGSVVAGPISMDSMGSAECAQGYGDPIVLFDGLAQRWLLSEFSGTGNRLCVYVSQTSDPVAGGWYAYGFTTPEFPDYPKYAVWPDAYYVTSNETASAVYALDRGSMLQGQAATFQRLTVDDLPGFGFNALTPADTDGAIPPPADAPGLMMRHRDTEMHGPAGYPDEDFLEVYAFHVDWDTPANTTITLTDSVPVAEFDSSLCDTGPGTPFSCFAQLGTSTLLDAVREVVMWRLQYRRFLPYEVMLGNFTVDLDGTDHGGIRWFELHRSGGGGWTLHQEGTWGPDEHNRWMGSVAMNGSGNIALGYSVSSSSLYPSMAVTGRLQLDPAAVLTLDETFLVVGTDYNASTRWGDYAAMSVDPVDDCTFWFTSEYGDTAHHWSSHVTAFRLSTCSAGLSLVFADGFESGDTSAWSSPPP